MIKIPKPFNRYMPYAPVAYLGRKNVEKILGAKIDKPKHWSEQKDSDEK